MDTGRHLSGLRTLVLTSQHLFSIKYAYFARTACASSYKIDSKKSNILSAVMAAQVMPR